MTAVTGPVPAYVRVTTWRTVRHARRGVLHVVGWRTLARWLEARGAVVAPKPSLPIAVYGHMLDGRRADAEVRQLDALVLDHDHHATDAPVSIDRAHDVLAGLGLAHLAHESPSHAPGADRWRLILPLAQPWADSAAWPDAYDRARQWIAELLGASLDRTCRNPSRGWYPPSRPDEATAPRRVIWHPGPALDLAETLAGLSRVQTNTDSMLPDRDTAPAGTTARARAALARETAAVAGAEAGERNETLNVAALTLGHLVCAGELREAHVTGALLDAAAACGRPPGEARATVRSGLAAGMREPPRTPLRARRPAAATAGRDDAQVGPERDAGGDDDLHRPDGSRPLTDLGNAERLVARHGRDIHYCHAWGRWLVWDRRRWRGDDTGAAERLAVRTVRSIYREAERAPTKEGSDAIAAHARRSESRQRIESMLALARSQPGVPVRPDDLDRDPWLLNVANGTIDLRTGELRKHRREDLATRLAPVDYDEQARAPLWDAFLARILPDGDVRAYMRRWMGYALTGVIREHVLVIAHGSGANAKTTFVDAGRRALGDYARTIPAEVLLARTHDAHPTERAQLLGVRLAITSESDQGRRLDEGTVKTLTGGDRITARFMRQDFFEFSPTHKLILMTNHKPRIRGTDVGIWRRIMLVPFPVVIPEAERDPALPERIATETPGILAWAVRGCLEWQARGLAPPAAVREATASYQRDEDTLGEYLAERTVADAAARTSAADLHRDYVAWAERAGVRPAGQRDLAEALAARSYVRHTLHGRRVYRGVRLLATGDGVRVGDHLPYCPTRGENSQRTGTPSPTLTLAGRDDEGEGWPS